MNELEQGIQELYASQADVMIRQYKNIEALLGPTPHYTAPGTH